MTINHDKLRRDLDTYTAQMLIAKKNLEENPGVLSESYLQLLEEELTKIRHSINFITQFNNRLEQNVRLERKKKESGKKQFLEDEFQISKTDGKYFTRLLFSSKNDDLTHDSGVFTMSVESSDRSAKFGYDFTREEFDFLIASLSISEGNMLWCNRHGQRDCKIDIDIPARVLSDGSMVPNLTKKWSEIEVH